MRQHLLIILSLFQRVFGFRYDLSGASFLQDIDISIGYKQWVVISAFNMDYIEQDFVQLEQMKERLFKYIEHFKDDKERTNIIGDSIWNLQRQALETKAKEARDKFEDMHIYLGDNTKSHEKRAVGTIVAGAVGLGAKIASTLWDWHIENKNNEKLNIFLARYNASLQNLEADVEELVSYTDTQVSFNRNLLNRILSLEEDFQSLNIEINKAQHHVNTKLYLQYQYQYLHHAYQRMINLETSVVDGLVQASKGKAQPPFLSPNKVLEVLNKYQNSETTEKSFFNKEDILYLYNMVETQIEKEGNEVAVLNTVKLPTESTKARLFKIITYPLFQEESGLFLTIRTKFAYIAINTDSKYMLLSHSDINSCKKTQNMLLCDSNEKMFWSDRDTPTCESSMWFQDQELIEKLCDFDVEENDDDPHVKYVENSVYHFSLAKTLSVPLECTTSETQTSENLQLEKNGFLKIASNCKAAIGGSILKNLANENVDRYEIIPDLSTYNIENIEQLKHEALEEAVEEAKEHESLINDELLAAFVDEHEAGMQSGTIKELFEAYKRTAETRNESREKQALYTEEKFQRFENSASPSEAGKKTIETIIIALAAGVSFIFIATLVIFCTILKMSQK